jgi:starch synthase
MSCISTTGKPPSPPPGCTTKAAPPALSPCTTSPSRATFAPATAAALGLPEHAWRFDGVEYHGQLSFLKAGLQLATLISTVSPTYAREIQDEAFGYGLAPLLRHRRRLRGILNGVDTPCGIRPPTRHWPQPYAANRLAAKRENKTRAASEMGLDAAVDRPLFGIISRLTEQKGPRPRPDLGEGITHLPAQLVVSAAATKLMEAGFRATGRAPFPDKSRSSSALTKRWPTASKPAPTAS